MATVIIFISLMPS